MKNKLAPLVCALMLLPLYSIAQVTPSTDTDETWYYLQSAASLSYCASSVVYNTAPQSGHYLRWGDKVTDENALWKFVDTGAHAFRIVNKATGLYICATTPGSGAGEVFSTDNAEEATAFVLTRQSGGTESYVLSAADGNPLHAQENFGWMVTWADRSAGSASSWKFVQATAEELQACEAKAKADAKDYRLVWAEEFNADGRLDARDWSFERGFVRNQELQWYQSDNAFVADGLLNIEGKRERVKNPNYDASSGDWKKNQEYAEYTSASLNTSGKHVFTYGRLEVCAKIPTAVGAWPAIWTLGYEWGGDDHWPHSGEIDLLEYYGAATHANFCWGGNGAWTDVWHSRTQPIRYWNKVDRSWAQKFHTWRMDWDSESVKLYIDDELVAVNNNARSYNVYGSTAGRNPFIGRDHYLLLNLAMGSNAGTPDEARLPFLYQIDYVRLYQKPGQTHTNRGVTETTTPTTAIAAPPTLADAPEQTTAIYDLSGRRLSRLPRQGVALVGGKVVVRR